MNTLGKTLIAVIICVVITLVLIFSRDFGAPYGYAGEGFGTMQEALNSSMGDSYDIKEDVGFVTFDDAAIYLCETKDNKVVLSYLFLNRQKDKYYLESYYIIDFENTQWHSSENKTKTNYKVTLADEIITNCDNLPVNFEEYTITLGETATKIKLYYNRVE